MKNLFKVLSLAAFVAVMFASCQKEEAGLQPETSNLHTDMPVITYDNVFEQDGKAPVQKKYTYSEDFSIWCQKFNYSPLPLGTPGTWTHAGDPIEYPATYVEYNGVGKIWLRSNFNEADLFNGERMRSGQLFTTYKELEQMMTYNTNLKEKAKYGFFMTQDDAAKATWPTDDLGLGRIPTMADVQHCANATKETANASFEYLYHSDKLNMIQYGWTRSDMSGWGGVGADCMIWLKEDPSWSDHLGRRRKSDYPYTILRSCDYIAKKGDNYTYLSIGTDAAYYNVRLVFDLK